MRLGTALVPVPAMLQVFFVHRRLRFCPAKNYNQCPVHNIYFLGSALGRASIKKSTFLAEDFKAFITKYILP